MNTPTTLVLLPGLDGTGVMFEPLLAALPVTLQPQVVSYPNSGPNAYSDLLPIVTTSLPRHSKFILLGWSFSGPLALMAAAQHPERLLGVVLCASFVCKPIQWVPNWTQIVITPFLFQFFPFFAQAKALLGGYSTPELREQLSRAHAQVHPAAFAERLRAVMEVDVKETLRTCPVPVLYLAADQDGVVGRQNIKIIQRINPAVRIATIRGPHLALQTNPGAASQALECFAQEVIET